MYELVSTSQFKYYNYKVIVSHELIRLDCSYSLGRGPYVRLLEHAVYSSFWYGEEG